VSAGPWTRAAAVVLIAAAPPGEAHVVAMKDIAFMPPEITVRAGERVTWRNGDIVAHTATAKEAFDIVVPPGGQAETVIRKPGRYTYICRFHPNMKGQIRAM